VNNERPNPLLKNMPWLQANFGMVTGIAFTVLFGLGAFLAIVFLFLPLINQADVARAEAKIMAGDSRIARLRQDVEREIADRKLDTPQADDRRKKVEADENKWKADKAQQQVDLDDLKASVRSRMYGYHWGMMIALVVLALGSLGYLFFGATVAIRVVGGVMIVAEMVVVLVKFLSVSAVLQ
jgi:hypothetical protein